jgi:tripartite-type tricarboxylate transporter receptor subunit TctC
MSKFLAACALALCAMSSWAQQNIFVVYPWSLGDTDAQYSRSTVEHINRQQKQLNFVLENRPGAGASIAAMHVARTPNTVLAASSAFFVRPNFFNEGVHSIADFRPLALICSGPLLVTSGKYKSWDEVPRNQALTIGLGGPGTTSHLVGELIRQRFPQAVIVPFKSTNEPLIETIAGRLDFAVGFVPAAEQYIDIGKLYGLGVTGKNAVRNIPSLQSRGFVNADALVNYHSWLVSKNTPEDQFKKMQELTRTAMKAPEIQEEFRKLYCDTQALTGEAADRWFARQVPIWRDLSLKAVANSQ